MSDFNSASDERTSNNTMRHNYRVLTEAEKGQMLAIKDAGQTLLDEIEKLAPSRETSIAQTKTEETVMWACKHVTN